jgi:hypothetical protein
MSRIRPPENIEIAALKKKQQTVFDPMRAGAGTPWEDRGSNGTIGGFFRTCAMSMFSPGKLTQSIRRPETVNDARAFLFGICAIWAVSGIMHYLYFVWQATRSPLFIDVTEPNAAILGLLTVALCGGGCYVLFLIYTAIYGKLAAQEKGSALLPDVLIFNVSAYALGPSLLALIPFVGPFMAAIWIFVSMITIGNTRLQLKAAAAVIDSLISLLAVVVIVVGFYYIVEVGINGKLVGYDAVEMRDAKTPPANGMTSPSPAPAQP